MNDSKKLYCLVSNLTSKPTPIPWPTPTPDTWQTPDKEKLADDFADFFEDKVLQIRKFEGIEQDQTTTDNTVPKLQRFAPLTKKEVMVIIK